MNARNGCLLAVLVGLCRTCPLVAQSSDSVGTVLSAVHLSVPLSHVETWERAVERVADSADAQGNAWRMYQTELSEYLLFAFGDPGRQSRVLDGFVGAPGGHPTDGVFAPLREVRYDVTQHAVWRLVTEWSTREEIDPAAYASITIHRYRIKPGNRSCNRFKTGPGRF